MLFFHYKGFEFGLLNWPRYPISPPMFYAAYIVAVVVRSPSIAFLYVPNHFITLLCAVCVLWLIMNVYTLWLLCPELWTTGTARQLSTNLTGKAVKKRSRGG